MHVEIQGLPWDEQDKISFTNNTCNNQQLSVSTAPLCRRCGCSLFQDALTPANADAISCDNSLRYYLDGTTRACEYCPVNQLINNHPAHRSCDNPDSVLVHQEWNQANFQYECVPGYFRSSISSKLCEPCALGQYQDELEQSRCKTCPGDTKTRHNASISSNDCAFCGHDRRLVQSEITGVFECVECSACTLVSHDVHMQQTCTTCGFNDYDKKTPSAYGEFCILENCFSSVRTDDFLLPSDSQLIAPIYEIQPINGLNLMNKGFLSTLSNTADRDNRMLFQNVLSTAALLWWQKSAGYEIPNFDDAMQGAHDTGMDRVYISFVDFFFRMLIRRIKPTITTNNNNEITSTWKQSDTDAYYNKNREIVGKYNVLYDKYENMQDPVDFQNDRPAHVVCNGLGARRTSLEFSGPAGELYEIKTRILFAGEQLSSADCANGDVCGAFFTHGSNYVTINNDNNKIVFADLSRFVLQDISFEIHSATGHNKIAVVIQHSASDTTLKTTLNAQLHWARDDLQYRICEESDAVAQHAVITDPWAFSKIRRQFLPSMCTNVNYA